MNYYFIIYFCLIFYANAARPFSSGGRSGFSGGRSSFSGSSFKTGVASKPQFSYRPSSFSYHSPNLYTGVSSQPRRPYLPKLTKPIGFLKGIDLRKKNGRQKNIGFTNQNHGAQSFHFPENRLAGPAKVLHAPTHFHNGPQIPSAPHLPENRLANPANPRSVPHVATPFHNGPQIPSAPHFPENRLAGHTNAHIVSHVPTPFHNGPQIPSAPHFPENRLAGHANAHIVPHVPTPFHNGPQIPTAPHFPENRLASPANVHTVPHASSKFITGPKIPTDSHIAENLLAKSPPYNPHFNLDQKPSNHHPNIDVSRLATHKNGHPPSKTNHTNISNQTMVKPPPYNPYYNHGANIVPSSNIGFQSQPNHRTSNSPNHSLDSQFNKPIHHPLPPGMIVGSVHNNGLSSQSNKSVSFPLAQGSNNTDNQLNQKTQRGPQVNDFNAQPNHLATSPLLHGRNLVASPYMDSHTQLNKTKQNPLSQETHHIQNFSPLTSGSNSNPLLHPEPENKKKSMIEKILPTILKAAKSTFLDDKHKKEPEAKLDSHIMQINKPEAVIQPFDSFHDVPKTEINPPSSSFSISPLDFINYKPNLKALNLDQDNNAKNNRGYPMPTVHQHNMYKSQGILNNELHEDKPHHHHNSNIVMIVAIVVIVSVVFGIIIFLKLKDLRKK